MTSPSDQEFTRVGTNALPGPADGPGRGGPRRPRRALVVGAIAAALAIVLIGLQLRPIRTTRVGR